VLVVVAVLRLLGRGRYPSGGIRDQVFVQDASHLTDRLRQLGPLDHRIRKKYLFWFGSQVTQD
jgi:hypothetical protein